MSATLCTGCGDVVFTNEPDCECQDPPALRVSLTHTQAAELSTKRWQAASLERIADALEEIVTFKENEVRERRERGH